MMSEASINILEADACEQVRAALTAMGDAIVVGDGQARRRAEGDLLLAEHALRTARAARRQRERRQAGG